MSSIVIKDLSPIGIDLFLDSENFLNELEDDELRNINGGLPLKFAIGFFTSVSLGVSVTLAVVAITVHLNNQRK
ncbi:hypothetical protein [Nodularia sp. UHCC 0506]|uniref:hypothetical protein n=1 Tax=Nodularia sp. UHCC 0506 TaxID=3110243 RepID=UPI002B21DEFA|nr:hypothetical protein [Nodularia sp. UHCC 0506]MEA5516747.1 hypothetical protein [Nodularia sp. UHCC 0506]